MSGRIFLLFSKFLKFGLVGLSGLFLDFGLTFLVKEKLKQNQYMANSLGFCLACTSNYLLNRAWTFQNENPEMGLQFSKFLLIALGGLLLNNLLIYIFINRFKLTFYPAKLSAIMLVFFWNFSLNYLYTFN